MAGRKTQGHPDPGPHSQSPSKISRRAMLAGTAGVVGGVLLKTAAAAVKGIPHAEAAPQQVPPDPTKVLGRFPNELGQRSPFEQPRRLALRTAPSGASMTPLQELSGILTPADLHFERHHGGVPEIDPEHYKLLIHGMVERPMAFTLADLKRFPAVSRLNFIECSGNGGRAFNRDNMPTDVTPQALDGLLSTSEWTGVSLATLFREVGVKSDATWFLAEGSDAAVMTRSIPIEKAWDDALIAYGQNGEAIRPEQGYPARLLLPGWEGNAQIKWIRRIEVSDQPFMTREETSHYTDPLADCTARLFSFVMDAKSLITFPAYPYVLPELGWWEIRGLAWSGRGTITRVDISTNGGRTWQAAELQGLVLPKCTTRFRYLWPWDGTESMLMSRASDETGYVQPTLEALIDARGAGTAYHANHIRAWKVQRDGHVKFGLGDLL